MSTASPAPPATSLLSVGTTSMRSTPGTRLPRAALPTYRGTVMAGTAVPRTDEPEESLVSLLRLPQDATLAGQFCVATWLPNGAFALAALAKMRGELGGSWGRAALPLWLSDALRIGIQFSALMQTAKLVESQVGPDPGPGSPGARLQWSTLARVRTRSLRIDAASGFIDVLGMFAAKLLACVVADAAWSGALPDAWLMQALLGVTMATWWAGLALEMLKEESERLVCTSRDLLHLFLALLIARAAGWTLIGWKVVFLLPWAWLCCCAVLCMSILLGTVAAMWERRNIGHGMQGLSFVCVIFSMGPQVISYARLTDRLDGGTPFSATQILLPNAASWLLMAASAVPLTWALRKRGQQRAAFLAAGGLWRLSSAAGREAVRAQASAVAETQRHIDAMSEHELDDLVTSMLKDKQLPSSVTRVGYNLYRWQLPLSPIDAGDAPEPSTAPVDGSSAAPPPASSVELAALSKPSHGAGTVVGVPGDAVAAGMPVAWPSSRDAAEGSPRMDASPRAPVLDLPLLRRLSSLSGRAASGVKEAEVESQLLLPPPLQGSGRVSGPGGTTGAAAGPVSRRSTSDFDERLCVICYDRLASTVLLDCGHGGLCRHCGQLMFARPPNQCPVCRRAVSAIVHMARRPHIGHAADVVSVGADTAGHGA